MGRRCTGWHAHPCMSHSGTCLACALQAHHPCGPRCPSLLLQVRVRHYRAGCAVAQECGGAPLANRLCPAATLRCCCPACCPCIAHCRQASGLAAAATPAAATCASAHPSHASLRRTTRTSPARSCPPSAFLLFRWSRCTRARWDTWRPLSSRWRTHVWATPSRSRSSRRRRRCPATPRPCPWSSAACSPLVRVRFPVLLW